jgi:hypothetical protein
LTGCARTNGSPQKTLTKLSSRVRDLHTGDADARLAALVTPVEEDQDQGHGLAAAEFTSAPPRTPRSRIAFTSATHSIVSSVISLLADTLWKADRCPPIRMSANERFTVDPQGCSVTHHSCGNCSSFLAHYFCAVACRMANIRLIMRKIREILPLHFECGRTHREIAQAIGTSTATVWQYLHRVKPAGLDWPLPAQLASDNAAPGVSGYTFAKLTWT